MPIIGDVASAFTNANIGVAFSNGVYTSVSDGTNIYVGGSFNALTYRGTARTLDPVSGNAYSTMAQVVGGAVASVIADGAGGYYVGGVFTNVGTTYRPMLARIDKSGNLNTTFNANMTYTGATYVYGMYLDGSTLYIVGNFTGVNSTTRNGIAAVDATTGSLLSWYPTGGLAGTGFVANSIIKFGANLYIGGTFTSIGGVTRTGLAAVDTSGTVITEFNPVLSTSAAVKTITTDGTNIYFGGTFTTVAATTRNNVAAVDTSGSLLAWNPNANTTVNTIVYDGTSLMYLGGVFTQVQATTRNRLAAVDITTSATLQTWNPNANALVRQLSLYAGNLYAVGDFTTVGGSTRVYTASISTAGVLQTWTNYCGSNTNVILPSASEVFVGFVSDAGAGSGQALNGMAAFNATTGAWVSTFTPTTAQTGTVYKMILSSGIIYLLGNFTSINANLRYGAAAIDTSGTLQSWNPSPSALTGTILTGVLYGTTIYIGGTFTNISGTTRTRLAALSTSGTGSILTWAPVADNGAVYALDTDGTNVYVGGSFTTVSAGTARVGLAAFDTSATLQSWTATFTGGTGVVYTLLISGSVIYFSGTFTTVNATTRNYAAALNTSATLQTWNPNLNTACYGIVLSGTTTYLSGPFSTVNGSANRCGITALDSTTGTKVSTWTDPIISYYNAAYSFGLPQSNTVVVGGNVITWAARWNDIQTPFTSANATTGARVF